MEDSAHTRAIRAELSIAMARYRRALEAVAGSSSEPMFTAARRNDRQAFDAELHLAQSINDKLRAAQEAVDEVGRRLSFAMAADLFASGVG